MDRPFSRLELLRVFSDYNESIWPAQLLASVLGLIAFALLFVNKDSASRSIATILAIFWATMGAGYHWLFFSAVNTAAYLFGAIFVIEALIFLVEGTIRNRIRFRISSHISGWFALAFIAYSLLIYPLLGLWVTHPYPETPLFGIVPCPTTIFTLGLLMVASHPRLILLGAIPVFWAAIGGTAAFLLDVPQDLGLVIAGLVWLGFSAANGKSLPTRQAG